MNNMNRALNKYKTLTYLTDMMPKLKDLRLRQDVLQILYCLKVHGVLVSRMDSGWDETQSPILKILQMLGLVRIIYKCSDKSEGLAFNVFQLTYLGQLYVNYAVLPTPQVRGQIHPSKSMPGREKKSKTIWIQASIILLGTFITLGCVLMSWYVLAIVALVGTLIALNIANWHTDSGTIHRNKYEDLIKKPEEQDKIYNSSDQSDDNPVYYTYDDIMAFAHDLDPDTKTRNNVPNFDSTALPRNTYSFSINAIMEEPGRDIGEDSCYCNFIMTINSDRINGLVFLQFLLDHQQYWQVSDDPYSFMKYSLLTKLFDS